MARFFYTLQSLGKLEQFHGAIFKEIHDNNNPLVGADPNDAAQAERIQTTFAVKLGIPEAQFKSAYHSLPVDAKLQRADELEQRYRIEGVPTFVVNGKYVAGRSLRGRPGSLAVPRRRFLRAGTQALTPRWSLIPAVVIVVVYVSR